MKLFRILLILIGAFLVLDTLLIAPISNFNLGVILPAILGAPLLLAGLLLPKFAAWAARGGFGAFLKWLMIGGYGAFLAVFLIVLALMLRAGGAAPEPNADALIILGAGVRGDRVSRTLARRLDTAANYWMHSKDTLLVVSGGQGSGETVSEAEAMERYLLARGIPEECILKEDRSTSTLENFKFSLPLIRERFGGQAKIGFVTTAFHVYRAEKVANAAGIQAFGVGCPTTWYLIPNNYLREAVAILAYRITGRIA